MCNTTSFTIKQVGQSSRVPETEQCSPAPAASTQQAALLPSAAQTAALIKARRSIFPKDFTGEGIDRYWIQTHSKISCYQTRLVQLWTCWLQYRLQLTPGLSLAGRALVYECMVFLLKRSAP